MFQHDDENGLRNIVLLWIAVFLSSYAFTSKGAEFRLLDTDKLELEYAQLNRETRDPIAPQYTGRWKERAALNLDTTLIGYMGTRLMWDHRIHTETIDTGAVKTVGWEWRLGLDLGRIAVFHHHHSRHVMDERVEYPGYGNKGNQFPVEDSLVIKFRFIGKEK